MDSIVEKSHVLAPMQRMTLAFIHDFIQRNGFAPTLKEIAGHIGVKSTSTAHFHLNRLIKKGFISKSKSGELQLLRKKTLPSEDTLSQNHVPLLGTIAAGIPLEAIETPHSIEIPTRMARGHNEVFCLEVSGDSMIDAHICDGDIVVVKRQNYAQNGDIVVALLDDGSATLKTFRRLLSGKVMLIPANATMQPMTLDAITIQGKLIGVLREYN